mmetsp:Transcript_20306/g.56411  ORF Transcript_20306/g.56411 Transcript_20306/m.56411 type:complete len:323 (-) Transcript_20306:635-1603(-)
MQGGPRKVQPRRYAIAHAPGTKIFRPRGRWRGPFQSGKVDGTKLGRPLRDWPRGRDEHRPLRAGGLVFGINVLGRDDHDFHWLWRHLAGHCPRVWSLFHVYDGELHHLGLHHRRGVRRNVKHGPRTYRVSETNGRLQRHGKGPRPPTADSLPRPRVPPGREDAQALPSELRGDPKPWLRVEGRGFALGLEALPDFDLVLQGLFSGYAPGVGEPVRARLLRKEGDDHTARQALCSRSGCCRPCRSYLGTLEPLGRRHALAGSSALVQEHLGHAVIHGDLYLDQGRLQRRARHVPRRDSLVQACCRDGRLGTRSPYLPGGTQRR